MKTLFSKLADFYRKAEDIIMVYGMLIFGALIMVQIVIRRFGFTGIFWLEEFSRYMFVISVFIGCSRAAETNGHMVMDMLYNYIPTKVGQFMQALVQLGMSGFSFFLCYYSYQFCMKLYKLGTSAETISTVKRWTIWVPVIICLLSMGIRYLVNTVKAFRDFGSNKRYEIVTDKEN